MAWVLQRGGRDAQREERERKLSENGLKMSGPARYHSILAEQERERKRDKEVKKMKVWLPEHRKAHSSSEEQWDTERDGDSWIKMLLTVDVSLLGFWRLSTHTSYT